MVMPAYNEEGSIVQVLRDHVAVLERLDLEAWEIVCVDDGSTDKTPELLAEFQRTEPRLHVIRQHNQGIYSAFTCCYRNARGTYIYSTGSDGQWPVENLLPMLDRARSGAGLVIGVRSNLKDVYAPLRQVISRTFNLLPRVVFGVRLGDAGSVKLGLREIFQMELISRSPFFEAERIIRAQRAGHRLAYVPIRFLRRGAGKEGGASWKNVRNSIRDLLLCTWKLGIR